jgi:hypothetical protein
MRAGRPGGGGRRAQALPGETQPARTGRLSAEEEIEMDRQLHLQVVEYPEQSAALPGRRWQPDRRTGNQIGGPLDGERRSGVDKRRQPRMPAGERPIYPD